MTKKQKSDILTGCLLAAGFFLAGIHFNSWSHDKLVEKCQVEAVKGWSDFMGTALWPVVSLAAATTPHNC